MFICTRLDRSFKTGFILGLFVMMGCDGKPARVDDPPRHVPASTQTLPDESLTSEEYIRLGVPAFDRPWSASDMQRAWKSLTSIAQENQRHLPRHQSERSGVVFARITTTENFELFRNQSLPLQARMAQAGEYMQALNQINKLYLAALLQKAVSGSDFGELIGAEFQFIVVQLELVDQFVPTLDKNDPTYETRLKGLERIKIGLGQMVAGGLETLTQKEPFGLAER